MKLIDTSSQVAFDAKSLNGLKAASKEQSPETIKEVAKQFEAVFMNMMLKSMRDATPHENQFDNEQSRTFISMLDQQLATNLSSKGLGLSDIIAKQLSKGINPATNTMEQAVSDPNASLDPSPLSAPLFNPTSNGTARPSSMIQAYLSQMSHANPQQITNTSEPKQYAEGHIISKDEIENIDTYPQEVALRQPVNHEILGAERFSKVMAKHAKEASQASGIPSKFMLGQAALESGWGKRQIKGQDGSYSYNLFGIKAGNDWNGKVAEAVTTEYINGVKHKRVEKFRAYDNYAESFKDFAKLMLDSPRYNQVIANLNNPTQYAKELQKAGYATDPNYAKKLVNVIKNISY